MRLVTFAAFERLVNIETLITFLTLEKNNLNIHCNHSAIKSDINITQNEERITPLSPLD